MVRFTLFCFFISIIQVMAFDSYAQMTRISLNADKEKLETVLSMIEDESEFFFLYNKDLIDVEQKVNVHAQNETIKSILDEMLEGSDISFTVYDRQIVLTNVEVIEKMADQQNSVKGKITDSSGQPLPGVTVLIKGTTNGVVADNNGNYSLTALPGNAILVFSFVGMQTQEIPVDGNPNINVMMVEDAVGIDEVVVVGYGTQKKSDITGAIGSVDKEVLESGTSANLIQTLQGRLPGMNITVESSSAEQNAVMMVRGPSSLKTSGAFNSANSPLVIVDGIPYPSGLSSINIADVESIDVLKDASSAAIYGTRASNGVILITTKKGQKGGKMRIEYKGTYGISEITNLPNMMNGRQFYDWKLAYDQTSSDPNLVFTTTELENYNNGVFTDWVDLATRQGSQQEHTFSISGGSEKNQYYFSANVLLVDGIAVNDKYDRYSYRFNFEQDITSWLKFGTNTNLRYENRDGSSASFYEAFYMNPLVDPYDDQGNIKQIPWPEDVLFGNPLETLNHDNTDRAYNVHTNNYFDVDIPFVPGLNYRLNTGLSFSYGNYENYEGEGTAAGEFNNGALYVRNDLTNNCVIENILSYKREYDKHSIYFTGLYSFEVEQYKTRRLSASNFPTHKLGTYGAHTGELIVPADGYSKSTIESQMGRLNYVYNGKYLATATVRRDGYSAFGEDTKYGIFPSFALGWNVGEEGFISDNISWIDNLKLRTSWGKNGNRAVGPYSTLARTTARHYLGGEYAKETAIGYVPATLSSPDLGWEFSTTINAGIDFSFLKGRLSGTLELYKKESEQILAETIPAVYGVSGNERYRNIGMTEVKGLELTLNGTLIQTDDFSWNLGIVVDGFKDKIISLTDSETDNLVNSWFIGESFKVYYGYEWERIWQEDDDIIEGRDPGDVKVLDYVEDGVIDENDRHLIGQYYPDFSGAINTNIFYKNFSVEMLFQGVFGNERPNSLYEFRNNWDARRNGLYIDNYWTPETPNNTYHANDYEANHPSYHADYFENASYLRLKNLKIGYDFTNSKINVANFSQLNVFMNASNLFTITNWTGLDPELTSQTNIPLSRTYLIGVNISL
ncbi:TonB-dependent receptor [uncultured Draconibacterium sp.]|uniref:TonB-dependent receptor n=1 Tax=uncultured Draconibacterium sp. TaxID=1573823 RepID=UPI002AA7131C|nr:TonB-dependent receptor [uncultured Draconibacterium sp.]